MKSLEILINSTSFLKVICIFNLILVIILLIYIIYLNKKYIKFMNKIGNGNNLDQMLKRYLEDVRLVKKDNEEIKAYYTKLDKDISSSVQKMGLVRFNAFRDVGSNLSFALALLDRYNTGVVLNGIYGSETSNIYAKPVKNGESTYPLSDEEKYAIEIAEQNKKFIAKNK